MFTVWRNAKSDLIFLLLLWPAQLKNWPQNIHQVKNLTSRLLHSFVTKSKSILTSSASMLTVEIQNGELTIENLANGGPKLEYDKLTGVETSKVLNLCISLDK